MTEQSVTVAVLGASGYTGGELIRLLVEHPRVELTFLSGDSTVGQTVGVVHPWLRNHPAVQGRKFRPLADLAEVDEVDIAFGCLPTGALPAVLPAVSKRARRVINVGGDFRLRAASHVRSHYPATAINPPPEPFTYFVPDLSSDLPTSRFISLPGCMALATLYAVYPLMVDNLVRTRLIADAKTGSTGGGRGGGEHPAERSGNFRVHKLHGHRHHTEVVQAVHDLTNATLDLQFSTYSLDVTRGIVVTLYGQLREGVTAVQVERAFGTAYANKPFIQIRASKAPRDFPMLKAVVGSNVAEVAVSVRGDQVVVVSALDNLLKGAAGQAVQALNRLHGFAETLALPRTAVSP